MPAPSATTAELLAYIAEVDARKLYLPAAYPSMFAYCVGELRLSEDGAAKRIQAERFPRPDVFGWLEAIPARSTEGEHAPAHVHTSHEEIAQPIAATTSLARAPRMMALSFQSFALQVTIEDQSGDRSYLSQISRCTLTDPKPSSRQK